MQEAQEAVLSFRDFNRDTVKELKDTLTDARKFLAGDEARIEYNPLGFFIRLFIRLHAFI